MRNFLMCIMYMTSHTITLRSSVNLQLFSNRLELQLFIWLMHSNNDSICPNFFALMSQIWQKSIHTNSVELLRVLLKIATWNLISDSRKDLFYSTEHLLSKNSPDLKTFLIFDYLHLYIYEEQWGWKLTSQHCKLWFFVSLFLYTKLRQHRKW